MKVLLVNGSPHQDGCTNLALEECAKTLNKNGIETEILWLGVKAVQGCIACNKCGKLGHCVFDDAVNQVAAAADTFDGLIVGCPVYYGGPCSQITAFLKSVIADGNQILRKENLAHTAHSHERKIADARHTAVFRIRFAVP